MFGIGLANAYGSITLDYLGGTSAALLYALFTRFFVGVGWFLLFKRAGKNSWLAFVPILGPYLAFRIVWDDFSFAALFGATTFIAFTYAVGVDYVIINWCAYLNFALWWIMGFLMARAYQTNYFLGFLYGGIPWLGALLLGLWPAKNYQGPWSTDPEAEQNLSSKERKKRRKKQAKEAKRQASHGK